MNSYQESYFDEKNEGIGFLIDGTLIYFLFFKKVNR